MTTAEIESTTQIGKIGIIVNPVSGIKQDKTTIIRTVFEEYNTSWFMQETSDSGDATRFAEDAVKDGCDLILACGGDGTVTEIAAALRDTNIPMGILPGGTGNVMAIELGIPQSIEDALRMYLDGNFQFRKVDMGLLDNRPFLLRCGMGYEAEVSIGAMQEDKNRWGRLAYFVTGWRKLRRSRPTQYRLTVDGEVTTVRGITAFLCNSTNIGLPQLNLAADTAIDDGRLDIIVVNSMGLPSILRVLWGVITSLWPSQRSAPKAPNHWQAREFKVETRRRQLIVVDGEPYKRVKRATVKVLPQAITVAVPQDEEETQEE